MMGQGQASSAVAPEASPARQLPASAGQLDPVKQYARENPLNMLMKWLKEEQNSHEARQPLQLVSKEKELLHHHLSDANTKSMIRRTDQLLPVFVLLGGNHEIARELIRTVLAACSFTAICANMSFAEKHACLTISAGWGTQGSFHLDL
jgi:hypothetical protein